jgi:hypothetical protein
MSNRQLGEEQRAALAPHARAWMDRALSTEPVDWARWQAGVRTCYDLLALRWPITVVRAASPLALARALFLARVNEQPGDEDRALAGMVRQHLELRVDRALLKRHGRAITAQTRHGVFTPVDAAVGGDAVARAVDEALRTRPLTDDPTLTQDSARAAAVRIAPRTAKLALSRRSVADWSSWRLHLGGQWDSAWMAYAMFLTLWPGAGLGPGVHLRVRALFDAQSAGWWWPHLDFILACERPHTLHAEQVGDGRRLHHSDGPAVVWPDGWSLYFWHGTLVPAWVVEQPTVAAIHAESNVEVRRCGIEALGWDAYLAAAQLRLVDSAADPGNPGYDLRLYDVPAHVWGEPARVLLATNGSPERDGTRRRYGLPVPADMDTVVHAAAWTYGLTHDQYAGLARRT